MNGATTPSPEGGRRAVPASEAVRCTRGRVPGTTPGPEHFPVLPAGAAAAVLRTPRLLLAPVTSADLEPLFRLHADPAAYALDSTEPLTTRAQMRWVLGQWTAHWQRYGEGYRTVRPNPAHTGSTPRGRRLFGVVGLSVLEGEDRGSLSAYWRLDPARQGQGIATEAMRAVLAAARLRAREARTAGPDRSAQEALPEEIVVVTAARNAPSRALAARLGFTPAPTKRRVPGGRAGDVLLTLPGPGADAGPHDPGVPDS